MPRGASLRCIAGPQAGRAFRLRGDEVVIGRGVRSGVAIADPSVSRRHLLLRRQGAAWSAEDLGSGNGTGLNGTRLDRPTLLRDGDQLILGATRFCFRVAPPFAARLRSLVRRRRVAILALAPLLLVAVAGLRAHRASVARAEDERRTKEAAAYAFQRAKRLIRQGDWRQAQLTFETLQAQAPDLPGLGDYLDRAKKEVGNQNLLERAKAAIEEDELGAAAEALGGISADTQLRSALNEVRTLLEQRATAQMGEAVRALHEEDDSRALEIAEDVLAAFPKRADAQALVDRARQAASAIKPAAAARLGRMKNAAAQRFRVGDLAGAIAIAEKCAAQRSGPCRRLRGHLREIASLLARADQLDLTELERLLELDARAAGGHASDLVAPAVARAAALYYNHAVQAKSAGHAARAVELAARVLALSPEHRGARSIVSELKARAKEAFVFAYSLKDTAPEDALGKFKEVLALTPSDDEFHRKAQAWIEKLSQ